MAVKKLSKPIKKMLYVLLGIVIAGGLVLVFFPVYSPPIKDPVLLERMEWNGESVLVITPRFTEAAYGNHGFYNYYDGTCGKECLSIPLQSGRPDRWGSQSLRLTLFLNYLGYPEMTDVSVHENLLKNPGYLNQYGTVILLHSEYVTKELFQAITSHPNVIYLAPNALYAEISWDGSTMTLIRGHNYPSFQIKNGFDWKHDNTPEEYDLDCRLWKFREMPNGYQINCSAEAAFPNNPQIIIKMKELIR